MEKVANNPDQFIASLPDEIRPTFERLDQEISKIMAGEERVLWTGTFWGGSEQNIIGYGAYQYLRPGKKIEWFHIGLAKQKNYISLYVNAVEDDMYLAEKYAATLGKVKVGKACITFKRLEDLNLEKLRSMLQRAKQLSR